MSGRAARRTAAARHKLIQRFVAAGLALSLHSALVVLIGLSLSQARLQIVSQPEGGAILASLTPGSILAAGSAAPPLNPLDALQRTLPSETVAAAVDPKPPSASKLLDDMDQRAGAPVAPGATARSPNATTSAGAVSLDQGDNPWLRASNRQTDTSQTHRLWAAIKPCWREPAAAAATSIRLTLGPQGDVRQMTLLSGVDPASRAAQLAARAITDCAPYRIGAAGAYLVVAPS